MLDQIIERARDRDPDGHLLGKLNQIRRDYADACSGKWIPTRERAHEYFGECLAVARHYARDIDSEDLAGLLSAWSTHVI